MKLSILIPVYNEEKTIETTLKNVFKVQLKVQKEIIVIDDGSTDQTTAILKRLKMKSRFNLIRHPVNRGKGATIKSGLRHASGNYILIQDADLEYNPKEIPRLLKALTLRRKKTVAIYGSRFKNKKPPMPWAYYLGNKFLTWCTNILYGIAISDMETGYKLLPRLFLSSLPLTSRGFDFEPEITAQLIKHHIPIIEVPISYHGRTHKAGKKLRFHHALDALKTLIAHRVSY